MRDYFVRAKLSSESTNKTKRRLGEPSVEMLRRSFEAMFDTVVELEDWPPLGPLDPRIAGVIVPSIEDSEIVFTKIGTTPDRGSKVIYRLDLFDTQGKRTSSSLIRDLI